MDEKGKNGLGSGHRFGLHCTVKVTVSVKNGGKGTDKFLVELKIDDVSVLLWKYLVKIYSSKSEKVTTFKSTKVLNSECLN